MLKQPKSNQRKQWRPSLWSSFLSHICNMRTGRKTFSTLFILDFSCSSFPDREKVWHVDKSWIYFHHLPLRASIETDNDPKYLLRHNWPLCVCVSFLCSSTMSAHDETICCILFSWVLQLTSHKFTKTREIICQVTFCYRLFSNYSFNLGMYFGYCFLTSCYTLGLHGKCLRRDIQEMVIISVI